MRLKTDVVFLSALLAGGSVVLGCRERSNYQPREVPTVTSTQLTGTTIVPTLDTPLARSGSAVWCATFQVAWNRACNDVIGGPLRIAGAQAVVDRLNGSTVTEAALVPGSYYAVAGRLEDGIVETIHKQMAQQFPGVRPPDFAGAVGFVTYGYLDTKVTFTTPFANTKQPIEFSDAAGVKHPVSGFGLHKGSDWDLRTKQAAQVKVLFSQMDDQSHTFKPTAFALDLTADQAEQELIVAVLPRAEHLRAALDDLAGRIKKFAPEGRQATLTEIDALEVPNVVFNVRHEFTELQGTDKRIENPGEHQGLYIAKAFQSIGFRLDRSGAAVVSEAYAATKAAAAIREAIPRLFIIDRSFLIVMKRRSADQPYFAAWIDNAELLEVTQAKAESGT